MELLTLMTPRLEILPMCMSRTDPMAMLKPANLLVVQSPWKKREVTNLRTLKRN